MIIVLFLTAKCLKKTKKKQERNNNRRLLSLWELLLIRLPDLININVWWTLQTTATVTHCCTASSPTVWQDNKQRKKQRHDYLAPRLPGVICYSTVIWACVYNMFTIVSKSAQKRRLELQRCGWVEMNGRGLGLYESWRPLQIARIINECPPPKKAK